MKKKNLIFAVDFDGTLVEHNFPNIGATKTDVLEFVRKLQAQGHKFILFTCRNGASLQEAINWCIDRGIPPDAVNDDVKSIKESAFGKEKSVKPFAHYYVDDCAVSIVDIDKLKSKLGMVSTRSVSIDTKF